MSEKMKNVKKRPESVQKSADARRGAKRSDESRKQMSESLKRYYRESGISPLGSKGLKRYNNGLIEKYFSSDDIIPDGFKLGRLKRKWVNNGVIEKWLLSTDTISEGFRPGKLKRVKKNAGTYTNGLKEVDLKIGDIIPDGFKLKNITEKFWCNNGEIEKLVEVLPNNFRYGRLKQSR